jgi:hypothetical protein
MLNDRQSLTPRKHQAVSKQIFMETRPYTDMGTTFDKLVKLFAIAFQSNFLHSLVYAIIVCKYCAMWFCANGHQAATDKTISLL